MSNRTIAFKFAGDTQRLDVPDGETPLVTCARHWNLPLDRVTLVWKGKRYKHLDATVDASDELFAPGVCTVLVLGTRAERQLDAPSPAAALCRRVPLFGPLLAALCALAADIAFRAWRDWAPAAARGAAAAVRGVALFFSSLVPRMPARRRRTPPA